MVCLFSLALLAMGGEFCSGLLARPGQGGTGFESGGSDHGAVGSWLYVACTC